MLMQNMKNMSINEEGIVVEESWELARAFAEDTRNPRGTNWPPRSYTCTFCRREFRSAQALGGHMNVHRRDRARLHHQQSNVEAQAQVQARYMKVGPNTSSIYYDQFNSIGSHSLPTSRYYSNYSEMQVNEMSNGIIRVNSEQKAPIEELDLELRLGHIRTPAETNSGYYKVWVNNGEMEVTKRKMKHEGNIYKIENGSQNGPLPAIPGHLEEGGAVSKSIAKFGLFMNNQK